MKFAPVCQKKEWGRNEKEAHAQIWFSQKALSSLIAS
jgi:hypothetical protein